MSKSTNAPPEQKYDALLAHTAERLASFLGLRYEDADKVADGLKLIREALAIWTMHDLPSASTAPADFREAFLFHLAHGQGSVCYGRLHYALADILLAFETAAKAVKPVSTSGDQVEGKAAADEALTVNRSVKAEDLTAGETAPAGQGEVCSHLRRSVGDPVVSQCLDCGASLRERGCPTCGADLQRCPECKTEYVDGSGYCAPCDTFTGPSDEGLRRAATPSSPALPPMGMHQLLVLLQEIQYRIRQHHTDGDYGCSICTKPSNILERLETAEKSIRASSPAPDKGEK